MSGAEIWQHINESLKILLWPAVAGWAFFVLRHKIKDRMGDLESVESPALSARFAKRKEIEVAPAVEGIMRVAEEADATHGEDTGRVVNLLDVREDIEEIVKQSFHDGTLAGRRAAAAGGEDPQVEIVWTGSQPKVSWRVPRRSQSNTATGFEWHPERGTSWESDDDEPDENYWRWFYRLDSVHDRLHPGASMNDLVSGELSRIEHIARTEAEILRLADELGQARTTGLSGEQMKTRRKYLRSLESKLAELDPDAPLLNELLIDARHRLPET